MNRIYHPYYILEETKAGMWRMPSGQELKTLNSIAFEFMNNLKRFSAGMVKVTEEWKYSCEHNLSCVASNRIAWLGQASVCFATGAPESCTRVSWYFLTDEQRNKANKSAEIIIMKWEYQQLGIMEQMRLL